MDFQDSVLAFDLLKEVPPEKAVPLLLEHIQRLNNEIVELRKTDAEQTKTIKKMDEKLSLLLEHFNNTKGFVETTRKIGDAFKWFMLIAAAVLGVWLKIKGFKE